MMGRRWRRGAAGQVSTLGPRYFQAQISPRPRYPLGPDISWEVSVKVTDNPNQVAVLAAYSLLSYLSLSAHNAWMRENTVSQTYKTLDTRLLILSATKDYLSQMFLLL